MGCPILIAPQCMRVFCKAQYLPTKFHYMGKSNTHTQVQNVLKLQVYIYINKPRECIHNSTYVFFVIFIILYDG